MSFSRNPTQAHLAAKADKAAAQAKAEENAGHYREAEYAHKKASELYEASGDVGKSIKESIAVTRDSIKADIDASRASFHSTQHNTFFSSAVSHHGAPHCYDTKPTHCHDTKPIHCHSQPQQHMHHHKK